MKFNNKENDFKILSGIKNISIIYIALISIFILSMCVSYSLPNKRIISHTKESIETLKTEGLYPKVYFKNPSAQLDNFTDSWMLNMAISADNKNPIKSSIYNPYKEVKSSKDKIDNLENVLNNKEGKTGGYTRYWHGYMVILRPLLLFLNYEEIRYVNMFALVGLFITINCLIKKQLGTRYAVSFSIAMIMVMFLIVPMSLQYSSIFYIMFVSMIAILTFNNKIRQKQIFMYIFFVIGAITSFMDLLTVPLLTLGVPLITYILLEEKCNHIIMNLIEIIKNSIVWAVGYATIWASKWIIASIVLKENIIKNALSQILSRTSTSTVGGVFSKKQAILNNTELISNNVAIKLFIMFLVVWFIVFIYNRKKTEDIIDISPILLIGVFPFICYIILANHSYMHFFFTYRNLGVSIFALISFMVYCIDTNKIKKNLRNVFR